MTNKTTAEIDGFDLFIWVVKNESGDKRYLVTDSGFKDGDLEHYLKEGEYIDICHTLAGMLDGNTTLIIKDRLNAIAEQVEGLYNDDQVSKYNEGRNDGIEEVLKLITKHTE